jgi:chromate transporter
MNKEFVELLSISQSLPGSTPPTWPFRKTPGLAGVSRCHHRDLSAGGILMYLVGVFYRAQGDHAWATAALKGVAACPWRIVTGEPILPVLRK